MGIQIRDMDKVEAWSGGAGMLAVGPDQRVVISDARETVSKAGNPQVELELTSEEGYGQIRDWLTFPDPVENPTGAQGALGRAKMVLDAVGIVPEGGEYTFPTQLLKGRKCLIDVAEKPGYSDPSKMWPTVVGYKPFRGNDAPADDSDLPF